MADHGGDPDICRRGEKSVLHAGRLDSIQVLRAVAAIGVVFTHAITRISVTFPGANLHSLLVGADGQLTAGDAGVDLFFAISGFIMLHVHCNDFGQPGAPLSFLIRRIARIVPLYWLLTTMALTVLIVAPQLFTTHYAGIDLPWIIGSYLFVPVPPAGTNATPLVGVGWTLNYEMFFYLAFAGTLLLRRRLGLSLIFLGFGCLVVAGVLCSPSTPILFLATNWLLLDFLLGVAIAWRIQAKGRLPRITAMLLLTLGAVCLAATLVRAPPEQGPLRFLFWGIPTALVVLGMSSINGPTGVVGRMLSVLGDASYSIYLFQFFALPGWAHAMRGLGAGALPFDLDVVLLTVLVTVSGFACWLLLERPLGTLVRSWTTRATLTKIPVQTRQNA